MGTISKRSVLFGGSNEYVSIGDVLKFDVGDAFSLVAWVRRTTSPGTYMSVLGKRLAGATARGYELAVLATGEPLFRVIDDAASSQETGVQGANDVTDGRWHQIVATKDSTETAAGMTMYVDGVDVTSAFADLFVSNGGTTFDHTDPLQISGYSGTNSVYVGFIDDCAVYDKELSPAEVSTIYNSGDPPDLTSVGPTGNLVGYWLMGDGDTFPTLTDSSSGGNDGTMTNMESGDLSYDPAGGTEGCDASLDDGAAYCSEYNRAAGDGCFMGLGAGGGLPLVYKMRGRDDGAVAPGYVTWTADFADFAGDESGTSDPPLVGSLISGSVVVVSVYLGNGGPLPPP